MRAILLLLVIGALKSAVAAPLHVEVWFLSPPSSAVLNLIRPSITTLGKVAANECVPMGDGCFHPQLGFVPEEKQQEKLGITNIKPPVILDVDLIKCDKDYYFDLYCGKAFKKVSGGTEVWFDVSTSMRRIDAAKGNNCKRKEFAIKLGRACKNIDFFTFNTSLRPMPSLDDICTYRGTNDVKSFMRWVQDSNAKRLIIITDVDEYNRKLQFFLESIGAHIRGIGVTPTTVNGLDSLFNELDGLCRKGKI